MTTSYESSGWDSSTTKAAFASSDVITTLLSRNTENVRVKNSCSEWTHGRVFVEMLLGLILAENLFSAYIIATTRKRKGSPFIISCIGVINVSSILMTLQLLFYPFLFDDVNIIQPGLNDKSDGKAEVSIFQINFEGHDNFHLCQLAGNIECRISGFLFGMFLFFPLVAITLMTIDTSMATFKWKMYRFRPDTASTIRVTLFVGFAFALTASFALPAFGIGTHYHYQNRLKICWLSPQYEHEDYVIQELIYFIFGFGSFLIFLIAIFGYCVMKANYSKKISYKGSVGHHCSLLCGQFVIMKSRSWCSYVKLVLWLDGLAIVAYLPLTAGYLIKFLFRLSEEYWFELLTEIVVLIIPAITPSFYVVLYGSHRKRAIEIFRKCKPRKKRISPSTTTSTTPDTGSIEDYTSNEYSSDDIIVENYRRQIYNQATINPRTRIPNLYDRVAAMNRFDRLKHSIPPTSYQLPVPVSHSSHPVNLEQEVHNYEERRDANARSGPIDPSQRQKLRYRSNKQFERSDTASRPRLSRRFSKDSLKRFVSYIPELRSRQKRSRPRRPDYAYPINQSDGLGASGLGSSHESEYGNVLFKLSSRRQQDPSRIEPYPDRRRDPVFVYNLNPATARPSGDVSFTDDSRQSNYTPEQLRDHPCQDIDRSPHYNPNRRYDYR